MQYKILLSLVTTIIYNMYSSKYNTQHMPFDISPTLLLGVATWCRATGVYFLFLFLFLFFLSFFFIFTLLTLLADAGGQPCPYYAESRTRGAAGP